MNHMDQLVREKFEHFTPTPPEHVWTGIQKGIAVNSTPTFFGTYKTRITFAAAILLLAAFGLWWMLPVENEFEGDYSAAEVNTTQASDDNTSENITDPEWESEVVVAETGQDIEQETKTDFTTENNAGIKTEPKSSIVVSEIDYSNNPASVSSKETISSGQISQINKLAEGPNEESVKTNTTNVSTIAAMDIALQDETNASIINQPPITPNLPDLNPVTKNNKWGHGIYFTSEIMLNDLDSVQLLPSYALNYEPSYHFNEHWFIRFGIGTSYQRERGFARLDYISNDKIGTYEEVYDVTFDSIAGEVVPTYHTKTTDVWDSVRHLQVTEVTNRYVYVQTPLLFGYYKKERKFNWFVYGGPAFNVMVSKWVEEPQENLDLIEIVDLQNNLPERSPYYMQLWLGAGIEYKIGKQLAIALEPNYRYYFNHVYKDDKYKTALSSFSLRFGVVFTVK